MNTSVQNRPRESRIAFLYIDKTSTSDSRILRTAVATQGVPTTAILRSFLSSIASLSAVSNGAQKYFDPADLRTSSDVCTNAGWDNWLHLSTSITIAPSIRFASNAAASIELTTPPDWASDT